MEPIIGQLFGCEEVELFQSQEQLLYVHLWIWIVNDCVDEVGYRYVKTFNQVWPCEAPLLLEESVNDEGNYAIPVVLVMAEAVVEDVARDHEGLNLFLLADLGELDRGVFLISPLQELHNQILDLQFNGLRRLDLVVMLKVDI